MNRYPNNFISALNEIINSPFVLFDNSGSIIAANKEAGNLFLLAGNESNFFSELTFETNSILNNLIESSYESGSSKTEVINIMMKDGTSFTSRITVNTFREDNGVSVILFANPHENKVKMSGITELEVKSAELRSIIDDENIITAIEEVRSLYPFTFIGKEKVLKTINNLDALFWIKDIQGNFVLVNNKMAAGLGLKFSQIEGKQTQSFIQPFISEFTSAIDKYVYDTINSIVLKGLPVSGIVTDEKYRTILIPLIDADENVIATIGIGQKSTADEESGEITSGFDPTVNLIDSLPAAVAIFDKDGIIKHNSQEFCKLLTINSKELRGEFYLKVLPVKIAEKIKQFIESDSFTDNSELNLPDKAEYNVQYSVSLNKIIDGKGEYQGISIFLEKFDVDRNFENLIKRRGRMFEILIQNNPEPMFIYDTENLRFIEANEAALSLYGYRKDEFLQMDLTDLYTPEDIQTLLDSSSISAKEGKFTGPFKHKKKDGTFIFVEISKISFNYNDKNAHFNIIKDVTEKLDLEKKNQMFRTAFENTGDLLFITDNVGLITFTNNPVRTYLEYQREELSSTSYSALVRDEERGTLNSSIFQSHIKDTITLIMELKKSDGSFVETEMTATPILDYKGEVESFCIIAKITKEEAEQPKEQVKEVVKEVIKEVIVEKPVPVEAGEGLAGNNINFFSSLFHEILTPINVILGFVQEFTDNVENLTPEQKEAADIINQNRDRLLNTMNSVMEFSSLEKGDTEVNPEEVAITEVIDSLYNEYKNIVGSRPVEFAYGKISSSLKFNTDKEKFQTLMGLLVKISAFINKEKKIYFSAYPYEEKYFVISIKDNYSFVSKYFLENLTGIFNKEDFVQVKDFGISKLTLRLTHSLLELLNGRLEILEQGNDKVDYAFIFPLDLSESMPVKEETAKSGIDDEQSAAGDVRASEEESFAEVQPISEESIIPEEKAAPDELIPEPQNETVQQEEPAPEENADTVKTEFDSNELENKNQEIKLPAEPQKQVTQPEIIPEPEPEKELEEEPAAGQTTEQVKPISKSMGNLNLDSLNCLYIEDQVDSQILFKVQMKELNDIKYAVSFEEALPLLDSNHFDFIVMDINLQGEYNGLDALKIIHKMPGYENIPIIAVTAYVLPGDKEKFIATGFNDFISKPIFREKMLSSLERIFLMQI